MSDELQHPSELRAAAMQGIRWVMIARPVVECLLVGSMVVLARLISPAEFGHYAVAILISGLGSIPAAAIATALVQRPEIERQHLQSGFALALLAGAALLVLTLLAASTFVGALFGPRTAELVRLSAPGCLIVACGAVPSALLQRRLAFRSLSIVDVVSTSLRAFGTVALALAGLNATALVLGVLGAAAAMTVLSWHWAPPPPPRFHRQAARELLQYGLPASMAAVSWVGFQNIDYAIVGARLGAVQAGFYFRAYTLGVEYQKKVSQVMLSVGFPVLSRARTADDMGALRGQMVRLLTVLMFPSLALLVVVAPVAVPWLFGSVWRPAVVPTQVLAVGGAATLVIDAVGATLMAAGRARALLGFGWAHFATYGIAVFFMAPLGLTAVAASAAVAHTAFVFVAYLLMLRGAPRSAMARLWEDVGPAVASCAALVAVSVPVSIAMSGLHPPPAIDLAVVALAGACAYALALRVFFRPTWSAAVSFVGRLLPRRVQRQRPPVTLDVLPVSVPAKH